MASYPHCTCGILKDQEKEFTARYEFKCSSDRVKVAPQRGLLHSKHIVKVYFIFEPQSPEIDENEETEMNIDEQEKSKKDNESKRKGEEDILYFSQTSIHAIRSLIICNSRFEIFIRLNVVYITLLRKLLTFRFRLCIFVQI